MKVGLKPGSRGAAVVRLHKTLQSAGFTVDAAEIKNDRFGASTLKALHALQEQRDIRKTDVINEATLEVLLEIEQKISINIHESAPPTQPPAQDEHHGKVSGNLVDEDGAPKSGTRISLFAQQIRAETHLGDAKTDKQGQYSISYRRTVALNLVVRAYDSSGKVIAQSATVFAAPAQVQINLTTALSGVVQSPSTFTQLTNSIAAQLQDTPLISLKENTDVHELTFLANAVGAPFENIAYLFIATVLGAKSKIQATTFFGLFYEGIPASLDAALSTLPDAGIDDAFASQVLTGVLGHSRDSLAQVLAGTVAANVLPASYASIQSSQLDVLDNLRIQNVGQQAYVRGKTSLNDLLAAGNVNDSVKTAFTQAYASNGGRLGPTWKTLRANKNLPAADLDTLNTTLSLGELLTGNLPLITDTLTRLSQKTLASIQNLALLDENDWIARITAVDPEATSIPPVLANDTVQLRIARFAKALTSRFAGRYPSMAFAGGLNKAETSSFAKTKKELSTFLIANPTLNIKHTSIDHFITRNKINISSDALADLKTAQRLIRISPHYPTVEALHTAGYKSAQSVYFAGRTSFLAQMTKPMGSAALAKMAYARAQMTYATALMAYARYNQAFNQTPMAAMASSMPSADLINNLPDLQALFGSLDYFQCEDCQSVYSPAAYLVDLLQYLNLFSASGGGVTTARDAFLQRRPDVQYLALDCSNTDITLPYIDLVNELFESVIAPPNPAVTLIDTTGTSEERRALPQQISPQAYALTAKAVFPLLLPFDLAFAQTSAYIAALGTTRAAILELFAGNPVSSSAMPAIAGARLGINPAMQQVINSSDLQAWERWGLLQNPDWIAALSNVPVLLNRAGLSIQELYQLLEVGWVTQSGVTLQVGTTTVAGLQILDPDLGKMSFTGLTSDVLDRANRFIRLWKATGLNMWELDWALGKGIADDSFLYFLSSVMKAQSQLNIPFQEISSFWMPLETRDVTNHLGDEDTVVLSTYSEVFRNPAVLASSGTIFVPVSQSIIVGASNASPIEITTAQPHGYQSGMQVSILGVLGNTAANGTFTITLTSATTFTLNGATANGNWTSGGTVTGILSGNQIVALNPAPPTQEQTAITASLGLSAADILAILNFTGAANALSLLTLNVLLQYQRLSTSLSVTISDLIIWIQLTGVPPFGGAPSDTLEFYRRLQLLQTTGLGATDLDYLFRGQSASQSSLAFTPAQSTLLLQAVCDATAKLPVPRTIPISGMTAAPLITVNTTQPNNLTTGTVVTISGVSGITGVNATFTITVVSFTSFTLDGSLGSGTWGGNGMIAVAAYNADTIQTIFVTALAAAIGVSANVVTSVLLKLNLLPLDSSTISLLASQGSSADPSKFPALVNAFTSVAKAAALFRAVKPTETEFAFLVQNAGTFNWLDPSALPLTPVTASPYLQFEALVRALKLDQRQPARTPKLFDVLVQWLPPNSPPADPLTSISGPMLAVTAVSNTNPISITTANPHGLQTAGQVTVSGAQGNAAANGVFTITVTGPSTFTLNGSSPSGAWTGGGTVAVPGLASAFNANVSDVLAIATELGAKAPNLSSAGLVGSLADVGMLASIANALDVITRYGTSGTALVQLAAIPATSETASAAMGVLQSQYAQSAWFAAIQPVEDTLRQSRRDALVAYLLGPGPAAAPQQFLTTDEIFNYYLIDPEMSACALMTRLLQGSLAIQQFVQQCFLNLTFAGVTVNTSDSRWDEWSWRKEFRLWQANREVFLYPENYLLPELRKDASPFFTDLENDLRQTNCDADAAEAAIENYLRKLVGVSRLQIAAHYNEARADGSTVLHVFAHTRGTPNQWYYRTCTEPTPGAGSWSAWQSLNLDIASQHLLPVVWDQHLYLIWPVFKQISEKPSDQPVPSGGGGAPQPAPQKFSTVEFAMSELSAGQWQAKQTIGEKVFLNAEDSPLAFTFLAKEDASFSLQIQIYFDAIQSAINTALQEGEQSFFGIFTASVLTATATVTKAEKLIIQRIPVKGFHGYEVITISSSGTSALVTQASLSLPGSPLSVLELPEVVPGSQSIDLSQEPTYANVVAASMSGQLPTPANYGFSGQDLVYGNYTSTASSAVSLNVLAATSNNGHPISVTLLKTIVHPRITIPMQEPVFDSGDPFFVADDTRTYLVRPHYFTVSSSPVEINLLTYTKQWSTSYSFETFYHPYARTFLRELEIGGVPQLMARNLQVDPQTARGWPTTLNFNFETLYNPTNAVEMPFPGAAPTVGDPGEAALDFSIGSSGAYSLYNWETFYHVPMFIASLLMQNQQYADAMSWLEYIFNPTDNGNEVPPQLSPQRFWEFAPFNAMNKDQWTSQEIQNILEMLEAEKAATGIDDPAIKAAINNWMNDPFDPHAVASLRIAAYGKATVMKFLDNLIAWGDWYYNQYTAEMVSQAEQLYIFADMILGPAPAKIPLPQTSQTGATTATYASLQSIDAFSNALVNVENLVVAPEPPQDIVEGTADNPSLPQLPSNANTLLFCIPPNNQLLAYWDKVSQRLYNIRHCLNLQGVPQPLPLYAPPINPLQLIEQVAGGAGLSSSAPPAPIYRFSVYLQKAIELTNDVRAYGSLILSALEKEDVETLSVLRANQEVDIQTRMLDIKNLQVKEAQGQIISLQNQKAIVQIRFDFYSRIAFLNESETAAMSLQVQALSANRQAINLDLISNAAHLLPSVSSGVSGFGGSPNITAAFGGENVALAASAMASHDRGQAGILSESAGMASTFGGYQRRQDEWTLQKQLAAAELTQMDSQITAATDRLNIANSEVSLQTKQINNAQAVSDFLTNKYTSAQLYNWMIAQLTTVYAQAYQLAFSLALQAQNAYQYELGSQDSFIRFGYWDSQHKGLTAGESLLFDLRRMEAQYLVANSRELELTKHVSLALISPLSLVMLRETGTCQIALDETLFESDHPGQYFRRLRSVAITIPCVTGPYTGVNATLSLTKAMLRTQPPSSTYHPQNATAAPNDSTVVSSPLAAMGTQTIAISSGQNDAGLFDVNLRDERWLPFEGQGAISTWNLVLDPRDNNFDFSTITDVILHLRYTARGGGDQNAANVVRAALTPSSPRSILVSVRNTFGNAYYTLFNPADTTAAQQALTLSLTNNVFPFSNLGGGVKIENIAFFVVLSVPPAGNTLATTFGPTGSTPPQTLSLSPMTGQTAAGNAISAITAAAPVSASAPQSFTLTIPSANIPAALGITVSGQTRLDPSKIEDILLVITYSIA